MRTVFLLVVAICVGYGLGYHDARLHDKTVVARIIDHIQNANQDRMGDDADKKLDEIERR